MANNNEKVLKPLKEICQRIETENDCSKHAADLKKLIQKGAFYEYYSFIELLEILSRNPKLPTKNKNEIFKLLDLVLREGSGDKDSCLSRLYNFLIKNRVSCGF